MPFSGKLIENINKKSIAEIFLNALDSLGEDSGSSLVKNNFTTDEMYDVSILGTGIESVNYLETVKFMFLQKEGIKLTDSTGKILKELALENPDINVINKEIWDQAIIWPIRHYSIGYWFKKDSNIDYSEINFESASFDFQFLKLK